MTDLFGRLEAGEPPARVAGALGLSPTDLVLVLARDGLGEEGGGPPLARAVSRRPRLAPALSETALAELFPAASRPARLALSAGLLQVHDFWEASHHAAQEADDLGETKLSAYWHAIAHRREPDPGNAAYWFRRVGRHPVFEPLARGARPALEDAPELLDRLLPRGAWDPLAFVDLCTRAGGEHAALARELQRVEMSLLMSESLPGSAATGR